VKKLLLTIFFFLTGWFVLFSPVYAEISPTPTQVYFANVLLCDGNRINQCGTIAGCKAGRKCTAIDGNYYCVDDSTCPIYDFECGLTDKTVGVCGYSAGCRLGERCQNVQYSGYKCVADTSCPTTTPDTCSSDSESGCVRSLPSPFDSSQQVLSGKYVGDLCGTSGETCQLKNAASYNKTCVCKIAPTPSVSNGANGAGVTPTITPTPAPLVINGTVCTNNGTIYPPNSTCYSPVNKYELINSSSNQVTYPISCVNNPTVTYSSTFTSSEPVAENTTPIDVNVDSNVSEATLGVLGPDSDTIDRSTSDQLAQKYLFNAIFGLPKNVSEATIRESFRTYWRMISSLSQAQLKSFYLENTKNHTYYYFDKNNVRQEVNLDTLKSSLPDCLRQYNPDSDVKTCWENGKYLKQYNSLSKTIKEEYDALLPFDFNNLRAYLSNGTTISKENIPYLRAIVSGVGGLYTSAGTSMYGLLSFYSPNWIINGQTPYRGQTSYQIASTLENETQYPTITSNSLTSCQDLTSSSSVSSPKTFPDVSDLNQTVTVQASNVLVSTKIVGITCYCPDNDPDCYLTDCGSNDNKLACQNAGCSYKNDYEYTYKRTGTAKGLPITVFNNPNIVTLNNMIVGKQTASSASASPGQLMPSFYTMLLPSGAKIPTKTLVSAPSIDNTASLVVAEDNATVDVSGANNVVRENNLAQNSMYLLQNCWLVPGDQQTTTKCGTATSSGVCKISNEPLTGACTKAGFADYAVGSPYTSVVPNVSPELSAVYAEAEKQTGVSCVILAAIHYLEANNDSCSSLISGRKIGVPEPDNNNQVYDTLLDTAIAAGNEFTGKLKAVRSLFPSYTSYQTLITAFSFYNGGGNSNCLSDPPSSEYGHCPAQFRGEDDPYAVSWLDANHAKMFLRCLTDGDCSSSVPFQRPGAYTVALSYYLSLP
jgi:hypothetical protein